MRSTTTTVAEAPKPDVAVLDLAEAVDKLRASLDISYKSLAERVGCDHMLVFRTLTRRSKSPNVYVLAQCMQELGKVMGAYR